MANIFEELMSQNHQLTEGVSIKKKVNRDKVLESKKICSSKIRLESRRIFEEEDFDELDDEFAVDPEGEDENEVVLVIDPELSSEDEVPEDAAEEMIGDSVYKCPICGANYVCNCDECNESVEVDEEGVPTECPICGDDATQILIGEIAPAAGAGEETEMDPVDSDDGEEEEETAPEALEDPFEESVSHEIKESLEDPEEVEDEPEEEEDPVLDTQDSLELVDCFDEDAEEEEEEEPIVEIDADVVNLNIDDHKFESMMTQMLHENYKFSPSFKITRASCKGQTLKLEYVIRGRKEVTEGILVAEGFDPSKRRISLKFRDKGAFTESFTRTPSFIVECVCIRNNIVPTSIKYNFTKKVSESLYRVYGTVNKKVMTERSRSKVTEK